MSNFWDNPPEEPQPKRKRRKPRPTEQPIRKVNGEDLAPADIVPPEFADDQLAMAFTGRYCEVLRYVAAWGRWMVWDGAVWRHDDTLRVYDLVRGVCRQASAEARQPSLQTKLASGSTVAAVEKLARSDRRHATTAKIWDSDPWMLNTPRGTVDLRSGDLLPHDQSRHMTKSTAVTPYGDCPLWLKFLATVTKADEGLQSYLQRVAGYSLTGLTKEHAMFFAYGTGGNGKGTFLNTIQGILGDYAMVATAETFTSTSTGRHLTELARLMGARLVIAQETEEGAQWAESRIKAITGGDDITANFMRQDHFTFTPQFKLIISGNHKPALRNVDEAIRRRFNMIPFEVRVAEPDPDLATRLKDEWPGILQWMVEGCLAWQQDRLSPPQRVKAATEEYFEAEDTVGMWMAQCCALGGESRSERSGLLFKSWEKWAKAAGEPPRSSKWLTAALISRGFQRGISNGYPTFKGIDIKHERALNDPNRYEDQEPSEV